MTNKHVYLIVELVNMYETAVRKFRPILLNRLSACLRHECFEPDFKFEILAFLLLAPIIINLLFGI
jgi:hypothetical protein